MVFASMWSTLVVMALLSLLLLLLLLTKSLLLRVKPMGVMPGLEFLRDFKPVVLPPPAKGFQRLRK